jgi:hypothetical protein
LGHVYVTFRYRLARHALREFVASLKSSAEILLLVGSHVVLGLLALSAFPTMYAASLPPPQALALLCAHALVMTIPMALLRKRVLPIDVVRWAHRLPIPPAVRLRADAVVAGLLAGPLALLYAVSTVILLWQGPAWLDPAPGILGTLFSLALTFGLSIGVLTLRSRPASKRAFLRFGSTPESGAYLPRRLRPRLLQLWHRLFWLPYWRAENMVGLQQSALLVAALASALPWMQSPAGIARGLLALATCTLMVLLTDRGDKAVREQSALLRPILAGLPLQARALFAAARAFSVMPALLVLLAVVAGGARHGLWAHTAGRVWLVLACAAPLVLVTTPIRNPRARVGLVVVEILLLTAVGSELWQ